MLDVSLWTHIFGQGLCPGYWWYHCVKGGNKDEVECSEEEWSEAPLQCRLKKRGRTERICNASGAWFPPWGNSWRVVMEQYNQCENGIKLARYAEVDWYPDHFRTLVPWARGSLLPSRFGLCFHDTLCSDDDVARLLVPMLWLTVLLPAEMKYGVDTLDVKPLLQDKIAAVLAGLAPGVLPGRPTLRYGNHLKQAVYAKAMAEAAAERPSARATAAVCHAGIPRSFGHPLVHTSVRGMLRDLRLTEVRNIFVLHMEPASLLNNPEEYWMDALPSPGLAELDAAFEAVHPDVLVTVPIRREGHPPGRECNSTWWHSCNAQWKSLELCYEQVKLLEAVAGSRFDWVVASRPDLWFNGTFGDIRAYDPSKVHMVKETYYCARQEFALVPRRHADAFFSTRRESGSAEFCWVSSKGRLIFDCECRTEAHLRRRGVPVARLPNGIYFTARPPKSSALAEPMPIPRYTVDYDLARDKVDLPPMPRPASAP